MKYEQYAIYTCRQYVYVLILIKNWIYVTCVDGNFNSFCTIQYNTYLLEKNGGVIVFIKLFFIIHMFFIYKILYTCMYHR